MEWKIGDLVQLKSRGPTMTVTNLLERGPGVEKVICTWYVGDEKNQEPFDPATLKAATPSD
jgi:uncharacterized protein YodC (DUF2158 family)